MYFSFFFSQLPIITRIRRTLLPSPSTPIKTTIMITFGQEIICIFYAPPVHLQLHLFLCNQFFFLLAEIRNNHPQTVTHLGWKYAIYSGINWQNSHNGSIPTEFIYYIIFLYICIFYCVCILFLVWRNSVVFFVYWLYLNISFYNMYLCKEIRFLCLIWY